MGWFDSISEVATSVADKAEDIFDKGIQVYGAKQKYDMAKLNAKTASSVAKLNAQAAVVRAKNQPTGGPVRTVVSEPVAPAPTAPQSTPVVISRQASPQGPSLGTLAIIALVFYGVTQA